MIKTFRSIKKVLLKDKNLALKGIRKLESTYNPETNEYHPHFHCIISGKNDAEALVYEWLKRFPECVSYAQDTRPADEGSIFELFKYFSKLITKDTVYTGALDIIFNAVYRKRTFQPMGIKKITEDVDEIKSEIIEDLIAAEKMWTWIETDWICTQTGETLTGYSPSDAMLRLVENIK